MVNKKIRNNSLILLVSQFIIYGVQFLVIARMIFVLDLSVYGLIVFSQAFVAFFVLFADFGFSISGVNKISKYRNNLKYLGKLVASINFLKIILFAFVFLIYIIFLLFNYPYSIYDDIILYSFPAVLVMILTPTWFFYGVERLFYFSLFLVLGKIVFALLAFGLIKTNDDYIYFPLFVFVGQIFALVYSAYFFYKIKIIRHLNINKKFIIYTINFSKSFIASRMSLSFNTSGGVLFLGLIANPSVVGVYGIADQIYRVLQTCVGSLAVPLYAHASKYKDSKLVFDFALKFMFFLSMLCGIIFLLKYPVLDKINFSESLDFHIILNLFIVVFWLNSLGVIFGYPVYAAFGDLSVVNQSLIVGSIFYFALLMILYFYKIPDVQFFVLALIFCELYIFLHRLIFIIILRRRSLFFNF